MTTRLPRLTALLIAVTCGIVCRAPLVRAHELGKTQATMTVAADGAFTLAITVDPDALATRLQVAADARVERMPGRGERDQWIASASDRIASGARVKADGHTVAVAVRYVPPGDGGAPAPLGEVRLTGHLPANARELQLAYDFAAGTFPLTLQAADDPPSTVWIEAGQDPAPIRLHQHAGVLETGARYVVLGFTHILPKGLDHILFVVGLFLLAPRWRTVVAQVSAFTLAHTVTLGMTMWGVLAVTPAVVEPLIALSIAYVAIENLTTTELRGSRLALVFAFGLLHGMGFAGVLREVGVPPGQFVPALFAFNAGVEAGQLTIVAGAFAVAAFWNERPSAYRRFVVRPACAAIAGMGVYWTVMRVVAP